MRKPFSELRGGAVDEFKSNGGGSVGASVSIRKFSGADACVNVLLGGVALDFGTSDGVRPACNDAF